MATDKEIGERLAEARKEARFASATEAAAALGMKYPTYAGHENGSRGLRANLERYARKFGVSADWLLTGRGMGPGARPEELSQIEASTRIPVFADVPAGRMVAAEGVARVEDVRAHMVLSGLGKGDWAGLVVNGHSMNKVAPDGSVIVFNRADTRPVDNGFFIFKDPETGAATFKRYGAGNPPRLRPYSYDDYDSILVTEDIVIVGRVKKVVVDL
jgi:transcriptional regulator with XRE-family HTH domain